MGWNDWKHRWWNDEFIRQGELGEVEMRVRPLRRYLGPLVRHWLANWKFWLNFVAAWVTISVAIQQVLRCKP